MGIVPHGTSGVNGDAPAPLRAAINLLSEGSRTCGRCGGRRIDGLAGYLFDADGREVAIVHAECVRPEERSS